MRCQTVITGPEAESISMTRLYWIRMIRSKWFYSRPAFLTSVGGEGTGKESYCNLNFKLGWIHFP